MDLQRDHSCKRGGANWSLSCCPIHLHFLPITEHYLCSQLDMGVNPFWLSCWCSLQISTGRAGERVRAKNKLGKLLIIVHRKESIGNDIMKERKKQRGGGESIISVIIQALVCKCCSTIDLVVFIALAIIDLLKPYFLLIGGFKCAANQPEFQIL